MRHRPGCVRKRVEETLASTALSGQPAAGTETAAVAAKRSSGPLRPIKFAVAGTCLLAGIYAVVSDQRYVQSDNAVVTAYVSSLRVPIEGTLKGFRASVGAPVSAGQLLGHVENSRANEERLHDLESAQREASGQASAMNGEAATLAMERERLLKRAAVHARAVSERLSMQSAEAEKLLAEKEATLTEAGIELNRTQGLHDNGIVSQASLDRALALHKVALEDVAAQKAQIAVLKAESEAANRGIFTEPGFGNDVSYSIQRVDEIELQLAHLRQSSATLRMHANNLQSNVTAESEYTGLMHRADLISPITGTIWKVEAQDGERLSTGDAVAQLVDCHQQFLLAAFPQRELSRLDLSGEARVKLSGESGIHAATILSVSEQPDASQKLAAETLMSNDRERMAVVRLAFTAADPASAPCAVGHAAQVMLPKSIPACSPWGRG